MRNALLIIITLFISACANTQDPKNHAHYENYSFRYLEYETFKSSMVKIRQDLVATGLLKISSLSSDYTNKYPGAEDTIDILFATSKDVHFAVTIHYKNRYTPPMVSFGFPGKYLNHPQILEAKQMVRDIITKHFPEQKWNYESGSYHPKANLA